MSTVETPDSSADATTVSVKRDSVWGQFVRYLVVGGIATVADFGAMTLFKEWVGIDYHVAIAIGFALGMVVNYLLSVIWVFSDRALSSPLVEFVVFTVIGIIGLGWTELIAYLGTDHLGLNYKISKLIAVAVVLIWNFGMRKILLFSRSRA